MAASMRLATVDENIYISIKFDHTFKDTENDKN
jgi:hypothetical protein